MNPANLPSGEFCPKRYVCDATAASLLHTGLIVGTSSLWPAAVAWRAVPKPTPPEERR